MQKKDAIFAIEMKKNIFLLFIFIAFASLTLAQNVSTLPTQSSSREPLREMRAVWLTTIGGLDWPHSYSQSARSAERQQQELCSLLDKLCAAGINTVLLQTRIRATTIFPSEMEPWDGCLSGFPGVSPGYDALAFAIKECHKRGMKVHAWVVSIPVGKWNGDGCKYLRRTVPNLLIKIGNEGFMNPETSETASYLARFCADITKRYDVDGIHLDYIRYPETWKFPQIHYRCRNYITNIVKVVHDAVKAEKPWVMMSCSPVGKYADTQRQWSHGWNARDVVFQDAALWLEEGYMDAIFPMMYFRGQNFYPFAIDWQERSSGKIVTPGLGIYFMDKRERNWPLEDITQEMHVLRQYGMGYCFFRTKFFLDNVKGLYDYSYDAFSRQPSLVPEMSWYRSQNPVAPDYVSVKANTDSSVVVAWSRGASDAEKEDGGILYNVYGSSVAPVDVSNADNLLMSAYADTAIVVPINRSIKYYAVTATNRYGVESLACQSYNDVGKSCDVEGKGCYAARFLSCDGNFVFLDGIEVLEGQLVEVETMVGNVLAANFVRTYKGHLCVNIKNIACGHYYLNIINRKGYRHRLGIFSKGIR